MRRDIFTPEQLMDRWEDRRAIKNLMGKFSNCLILNREQDIFEMFWSEREDVCLGFNDGWYKGRGDVAGYYSAMHEGNKLKARIMRDIFPQYLGDKTDEEIYGVGPFKVRPIGSQVIEIAEDGETGQGYLALPGRLCGDNPFRTVVPLDLGLLLRGFHQGGRWLEAMAYDVRE